MLELPPLSLYIHYPWCVKKCPYCDFNSHEGEDRDGYISALLADLDNDLSYVQGRSIHSIFIGGGTPSLMTEQDLSQLFNGLKSRLIFDDNIEITLETNPGTFEIEKFKAFKEIGINRLSVGVQSFNDKYLKSLGRIHNAQEAGKACTQAAKIFDNFNIDLMYGLQGQSTNECLADLNQAIKLNPTHISFYQLTIEPNTLFAKFPPTLPQEDDIYTMGEQGVKLLEQHGYTRYEVSAFGKKASKHNINYWEFGDYLGIGAGAHGKITLAKDSSMIRTLKSKAPKEYIQNRKKTTELIENPAFEFMLNALRLKQGFDKSLFSNRTGKSLSLIHDKLNKAKDLELLKQRGSKLIPTQKGFNFLNDLQALFL
ncbi:radical SAM family heme chaperone HemW [Candidatus Thioglobus autotrophicus]|jgi:putative oxygen-independent coproporphyrinogen III oxidase|uniref:radical SAM family heme chaperone HemW n=1 Tax=Candidatus Thioglobus autotrophicus TaxID=1705394 RepID=UPI00299D1108|nr:radical SAM family heme chaperone HemW [Candidatus Thioglobus autotrophicus]WPE16751.1 radical SAM family heme chaperone HemW [Candidatus Thioglobus autotrophicus]